MAKVAEKAKNCKYCDEDRMIDKGAVWAARIGTIACITSRNELLVNIKGEQTNIPITHCPFCGNELEVY